MVTAALSVTCSKKEPLYVSLAPKVAELVREGLSLRQIADRLDVSHMTVARAAHTAGVQTNGAAPEAAIRAWTAQARLAQVRHMVESFELADVAKARLMDALVDGSDLASVQVLNAVAGTWTDKGIAFSRLFKDAAVAEQQAQATDQLAALTEALLASGPTHQVSSTLGATPSD